MILKNVKLTILKYITANKVNHPKAVFFTCMDSRMLPTRFTETNVGDMFIVRNAGNLVPNSGLMSPDTITTEPAALELGCIMNNIRHVIVCGHSDCKAMNLLHSLQCSEFGSIQNLRASPLRAWLSRHGADSLDKFVELEKGGFNKPLLFEGEVPLRKFVAYIDPENKFSITDKLSQINCLQQLHNISSYQFMQKHLKTYQVHAHALWFDIYTGDIYYFSRGHKRFVEISETTFQPLLDEILRWYS